MTRIKGKATSRNPVIAAASAVAKYISYEIEQLERRVLLASVFHPHITFDLNGYGSASGTWYTDDPYFLFTPSNTGTATFTHGYDDSDGTLKLYDNSSGTLLKTESDSDGSNSMTYSVGYGTEYKLWLDTPVTQFQFAVSIVLPTPTTNLISVDSHGDATYPGWSISPSTKGEYWKYIAPSGLVDTALSVDADSVGGIGWDTDLLVYNSSGSLIYSDVGSYDDGNYSTDVTAGQVLYFLVRGDLNDDGSDSTGYYDLYITGPASNVAPTIGSLSDSPDPVTRGQAITLTAGNVADANSPNDSISSVAFYRDSNANGSLDVGSDSLLGTDTSSSGGWAWTGSSSGFAVGTNRYFARAQDSYGAWSNAASTTGTVINVVPSIGSLSASPNLVVQGQNLTLTANLVSDTDGTVSKVEFYRDSNGNAALDVGTDTLLGSDTSSSGGWYWNGPTGSFVGGSNRFFARAQDSDGAWSSSVSATATVQVPSADLTAGQFVVQSPLVEESDYQLSVQVANSGLAAADGTHAKAWLASDTDNNLANDFYLGEVAVPSLGVGVSAFVDFLFTMPNRGSGNYSVRFFAQVDSRNEEPNEPNDAERNYFQSGDYTAQDAPDSGDTLSSATILGTLSPGSTTKVGDQIGNGSSGLKDVDVFAFTLVSAGSMVFDVDAATRGSALDAYLRVFNSSGVEQLSNDDYEGNQDPYIVCSLTPGTYYAGVSGVPNRTYSPSTTASRQSSSTAGGYYLRIFSSAPTSTWTPSIAASAQFDSSAGDPNTFGRYLVGSLVPAVNNTFTAHVTPPSGYTLSAVTFDANFDGIRDAGDYTDTSSSGGWTWTLNVSTLSGDKSLKIWAQESGGAWSNPATFTIDTLSTPSWMDPDLTTISFNSSLGQYEIESLIGKRFGKDTPANFPDWLEYRDGNKTFNGAYTGISVEAYAKLSGKVVTQSVAPVVGLSFLGVNLPLKINLGSNFSKTYDILRFIDLCRDPAGYFAANQDPRAAGFYDERPSAPTVTVSYNGQVALNDELKFNQYQVTFGLEFDPGLSGKLFEVDIPPVICPIWATPPISIDVTPHIGWSPYFDISYSANLDGSLNPHFQSLSMEVGAKGSIGAAVEGSLLGGMVKGGIDVTSSLSLGFNATYDGNWVYSIPLTLGMDFDFVGSVLWGLAEGRFNAFNWEWSADL